jgi:periplasmic divalent cation tolerance protein
VTDVVMVWTTVPAGEEGDAIARALVDERLAACVSVMAPMTSVYRWEGRVTSEVERQLVIKTTDGRVPAVRARLAALHPYELPEFLVVRVADGSAAYLDWVCREVSPAGG